MKYIIQHMIEWKIFVGRGFIELVPKLIIVYAIQYLKYF